MGSRILTMKRQAAELGRIRTGTTEPSSKGGTRPARSQHFILTSHSRAYIETAAALYGGDVEPWTPNGQRISQFRVITKTSELLAVLPTGDPLSQSYEMWTGGGCARRCDGQTEQITRTPCVCLARYGEDWHRLGPDTVCRPTSRINVMLPDMPDVGVWRLETHSYYAADVLAGVMDTVLQATEGRKLMPVRMWIEQRKVVREGKTKQFPVVMVVPNVQRLRQALTGGISTAAALEQSSLERPAIEAPRPGYVAEARQCRTPAEVLAVYGRARAAGHATPELRDELQAISADIEKGVDTRTGEVPADEPGPDEDGVFDVEIVDDEPPAAWPEVAAPGSGAGR